MSPTPEPGRAPVSLRPLAELGPGTLGRQLVVRVVLLVAVVAILLGAASTLAARHQLIAAVDANLQAAVERGQRHPGDERGFGKRPMPGTEVGQVTVSVDDELVHAVLWVEGGNSQLAQEVTQQLLEASPTEPTTMRLTGLDDYRVLAAKSPDGTQIVALPLSRVEHTLRQLLWLVLVLLGAAITAAVLAARTVVVRSLKPLNRLASTATEVSNLSLDRGEVVLPQRVEAADADPTHEVGRVGFAFNHMLDNVEAALATRQASETRVRQFVADASHELRNPLASIRGYAELTRRGRDQLPEDTRFALGRIEAESTRMSHLVEDMLLLARLDDDPTLELAPTNAAEVVLNAVSDAQVAGPNHQWSVELPDQPVMVQADALKLHQVVANLLANARTHTPPGTQVHCAVTSRDGQAHITVLDDGPGIDDSIRDTAFERFARADASRTHTAESSTGLGLAIVAAVMAAHGGSVALDSRPGHTCFTLSLPLAQQDSTVSVQHD